MSANTVAAFTKLAPPDAKIILLSFPWTGGNPTAWKDIQTTLAKSHIHLCPLQLPGRDMVVVKKPMKNWQEMCVEIVDSIKHLITSGKPYAVVGHSFGAWVGYEVIREIHKRGNLPFPVKFIVSAKSSPEFPIPTKASHLPQSEFWKLMVTFGMDPNLVQYKEFTDAFYPFFQNDYYLQEIHETSTSKIPVPITAINPTKDIVLREHLAAWEKECGEGKEFKIVTVEGGTHMYIMDPVGKNRFCEIIKDEFKEFI